MSQFFFFSYELNLVLTNTRYSKFQILNNMNEPKQDKFKINNTHNNQPNNIIIILSVQNHIPINKIANVYPAIINKYYRHIHLTTTKHHDLNDKKLSLNSINDQKPDNSTQIPYTTINHTF